MPRYTYAFTEAARDDINKLDPVTKKRLAKKLQYFVDSGNPMQFAEPLISPLIGSYRFRVGDYRIVFDRNGSKLIILRVRHRREVYE